jgi:hypothetical protein
VQKEKKAKKEQRAIQAAHAAISTDMAAAQQKIAEQEQELAERCQREQSELKDQITGARLTSQESAIQFSVSSGQAMRLLSNSPLQPVRIMRTCNASVQCLLKHCKLCSGDGRHHRGARGARRRDR